MQSAPYLQKLLDWLKFLVSAFVPRENLFSFVKRVILHFDVWSYVFPIIHLKIIDIIGAYLRMVLILFTLKIMRF